VRGPLAWTPPERPHKNWWALFGGPLVFVGVLLYFVSQIHLPYVQIAPGGAEPINELLRVPETRSHPPKGSFLLTTVSLNIDVRPFDLVRDFFDPDVVVIARKDVLGDSNEQQYNQAAVQDMDDSKQSAIVVAMRTLGYPVPEHGAGSLVAAVADGDVPVKGVLTAGDVITAIDGVPTMLSQEAIAILQKHKPSEPIVVTVTRSDKTSVQRTVQLGSRGEDGSCSVGVVSGAGACMGVILGTKDHKFDFPFEVSIDTKNVGGPSAGLAFALALIDELTPGELTGGRDVAVTGTIDVDGTVGDVGGVVQKTAAVRHAGARLFLVPPGEFAEARKHAGKNLKVVQVATLRDALDALRANGGAAFATANPPVRGT
jgi:PDZ domain-containing protein